MSAQAAAMLMDGHKCVADCSFFGATVDFWNSAMQLQPLQCHDSCIDVMPVSTSLQSADLFKDCFMPAHIDILGYKQTQIPAVRDHQQNRCLTLHLRTLSRQCCWLSRCPGRRQAGGWQVALHLHAVEQQNSLDGSAGLQGCCSLNGVMEPLPTGCHALLCVGPIQVEGHTWTCLWADRVPYHLCHPEDLRQTSRVTPVHL